MDILSTLKGEYARTVILIVIPGAVALQPYYSLLLNENNFFYNTENTLIFHALIYLLLSIFIGYISQDFGARLEICFDKIHCKLTKKNYDDFLMRFNTYLFNKRDEDLIATHYYRSMLIRLKFELHMISAILILLVGLVLKMLLADCFIIDWPKSIIFLITSISLLSYLSFEAIKGVETLDYFRLNINRNSKMKIDLVDF